MKQSGSKSRSSAADDSGPVNVGSPLLSPLARFWIAVALVLALSALTFMQSPRPDALRPPRWFVSTAWWRYPLEWNAANRLAKIECSLKAINAVPNSSSIWAVGNKGMVVSSGDGGTTWTKKGIEESQLTPGAGPLPSPSTAPSPAAQSSLKFLDWFDVVPTAAAKDAGQEKRPPTRQATPPELNKAPEQYLRTPTATPTPQPAGTITTRRDTPGSRPTPTPERVLRVAPRGLTPEQTRRVLGPAASPSPSPRQGSPNPSASPPVTASPSPTPIQFPPPSPETEQLIAVYFSDEKNGEAVDGMGWRYTTTDSGVSWKQGLIDAGFFRDSIKLRWQPLQFLQLLPQDVSKNRYFAVTQDRGAREIRSDSYQSVTLVPLANFSPYGVQFLPDSDLVWIVGASGSIYRVQEGLASKTPSPWERVSTPPYDLHGIFFLNEDRGWVVGEYGAIFRTVDAGKTWTRQESNTTSQLNSVNFGSDEQRGWIAGNDGLILSTENGGDTWVHRTQGTATNGGRYLRFPAPWYFLSLLIIGLLVWRKPKEIDAPAEESVADVLVSDRPLEEATGDVLAFNTIARGLSRFLRNENTLPPLTIAITGEWGTGKSSLMNLLRADLRSYKFRPVWFNAWHHQKEEHMLASLLENIKLQAVPRWWTMRGLLFRASLLRIRGVRQWGPLVLLLFFIYVVGIYYYYADEGLVNTLKIPLTPAGVIEVLPILAGVVTFAGALWRGITAFGVKPASLLAGVSRGASIRGLEAQTSFRQKFAVEFNDVTRALGKRSMLIFIDDLDRCRPENVLETLEAVNFLTTSGECFVVIGMAREYVERCVGRAFNEVAQEMVDDLEEEMEETAEDIAKQKRIEFARQYLDKLINIEVPVPAPKQSQSLALLVASTRNLEKNAPLEGWSRFRLSLVNFVARRWKLVPALVAAGALIVLGYYLARGLAGGGKPELVAETAPVVTEPTPEPVAPAASSASSPEATPLPSPIASPTPVPSPDTESPVLVPGSRALVSPGVLPLLTLLALIWLGSTILNRKPGFEVRDSANFVTALEIWHPLVFARLCTPRATKRFMNFVRYLAMRQRRQSDREPPLKSFLANLKRRLTGVRTSAEVLDEVVLNAESAVPLIPDEVLVALAALQHLNPDCLADQPGPVSSPDQVWPRAMPRDNLLWPLFEKARENHEAKFHNWATLNQYRDQFREMTANVQVR